MQKVLYGPLTMYSLEALIWMTLNQRRGYKTRCYECLINEQVNQQEIQQDFNTLSNPSRQKVDLC